MVNVSWYREPVDSTSVNGVYWRDRLEFQDPSLDDSIHCGCDIGDQGPKATVVSFSAPYNFCHSQVFIQRAFS